MVLDEFTYGAKKSALIRVLKGKFGFVAGKVADTGGLIIDTPLARLRSTLPPMGFGSFAFSAFIFCFIRDVKAASQDIGLLDDGKITCSDLQHGVFELITKEANPQVIIVDNPCDWLVLTKALGSSAVGVSHVTPSAAQIAQVQTRLSASVRRLFEGASGSNAAPTRSCGRTAANSHGRRLLGYSQ